MVPRGAPHLTRRSSGARSSTLSWGSALSPPSWRCCIPFAAPLSLQPAGEPATASVVAARLADMAPNTGIVFKFGNIPGLLLRTPDGELRAFSAVCTYLQCTVQYRADTSQICHRFTSERPPSPESSASSLRFPKRMIGSKPLLGASRPAHAQTEYYSRCQASGSDTVNVDPAPTRL